MRTGNRAWRAALATAVMALAIPAARAQSTSGVGDASGSPRMRPMQQRLMGGSQWWNNPEMVEALGLDPEARQRIDEEVYRSQQEMITLRAEVEKQDLDLERLLRAPETAELGVIEEQVQRFVDTRGQVMKAEIMLRAQIMHMLTPEQRASLERIFEERRREFRDRAMAPRRPAAPPTDGEVPAAPPDEPPPLP